LAVPANLTPDYRAAEERFRSAVTIEEKLEALEDMLATVPKHKGTEKLQADIKSRIAKLKKEAERRPATARKAFNNVERQGAGQVVLVGPPNVGKSHLLASLTNATPEIADYPGTTRVPLPGMVRYENVQFQLVDLPPVEEGGPAWILGVVRNADVILVVLDLGSDDVLEQAEITLKLLEQGRLLPVKEPARSDQGESRAVSKAGSQAVSQTVSQAGSGRRPRSLLVVANKLDARDAAYRLDLLLEAGLTDAPILPVSAMAGTGLDNLAQRMYEALNVIRIYTKPPGKKPDYSAPFVLPRGSTIMEAAETVHKDVARNLKFAKVWGKKTFDGQMVQRDYVLADGDVVEFHS
jgi:ribosome-interacting GTPase 1